MIKGYIEQRIYDSIVKNFNFKDITEIRLRLNEKIVISVGNKKYFLKDNNEFLTATKYTIENFILKASENSIYAHNDNIVNGYLTLPNGVRVGVSGYVVSSNEKPTTIKDFQAVNIRIPHIIKNCSLFCYEMIVDDKLKDNILVVSPVGCGKTTFIRDFVFQLAEHNVSQNVLICDERNEIATACKDESIQHLGCFTDIYTNCSKEFAFKNGIRSMAPDIIVTDEIDLDTDVDSIKNAINCGVKVIATIHATDIEELIRKPQFKDVVEKNYFTKYIVLSNSEGIGTVSKIYNSELKCIYSR